MFSSHYVSLFMSSLFMVGFVQPVVLVLISSTAARYFENGSSGEPLLPLSQVNSKPTRAHSSMLHHPLVRTQLKLQPEVCYTGIRKEYRCPTCNKS